jgi:arginyl-tRNA synthetase
MKHDSLINILRERFAAAVAQVAGTAPGEIDPVIRPAGDPKFGDYQCNVAMSLAKTLKSRPRDIAQRIVEAVDLAGVAEPPEIAGPGFINVRLADQFLAGYLGEVPAPPPSEPEAPARGKEATGYKPVPQVTDRLGMPPVERPRKVVIDYSSPNIAKQMHVGHLRSTIIGDVFARVLMFEGHEVIRQNHVGDWGTQFGMLIQYYEDHPLPTPETHADVLAAAAEDYRAAQQRFNSDPAFAEAARAAVGRLQGGDPEARRKWEQLCATSRRAFLEIYLRLNVLLNDDDVCGESFYNDRLGPVVAELRDRPPKRDKSKPTEAPYAELREDAGAQCLFLYDEHHKPQFTKPDGEELPMIIQKSDGAFLYATTDLAAIRYRVEELGADRLIYVTDARQKLHFETLFAAARAIGWAGSDALLEHATFGTVLGDDRKPLKAREGQSVALRDLLDEAERRARELLDTRSDEATERRSDKGEEVTAASFSEDEKREIARRVGIASVKYADLRNDRVSDYVFDWDKMLAMQGNTAPYMMYAYARIRSIYRKAAERFGEPDVYAAGVVLALEDPAERALALKLGRLRETIDSVAADLAPHVLCTYLYELASEFMRFYESCPVLKAPDEASRLSRMRLCDLTARALKLGLGLLGIETIERM